MFMFPSRLKVKPPRFLVRGLQIVDKVDKMETVENFLRQGAAESQLVSDLLDRDPAGLRPATQYEGVCLRFQSPYDSS